MHRTMHRWALGLLLLVASCGGAPLEEDGLPAVVGPGIGVIDPPVTPEWIAKGCATDTNSAGVATLTIPSVALVAGDVLVVFVGYSASTVGAFPPSFSWGVQLSADPTSDPCAFTFGLDPGVCQVYMVAASTATHDVVVNTDELSGTAVAVAACAEVVRGHSAYVGDTTGANTAPNSPEITYDRILNCSGFMLAACATSEEPSATQGVWSSTACAGGIPSAGQRAGIATPLPATTGPVTLVTIHCASTECSINTSNATLDPARWSMVAGTAYTP